MTVVRAYGRPTAKSERPALIDLAAPGQPMEVPFTRCAIHAEPEEFAILLPRKLESLLMLRCESEHEVGLSIDRTTKESAGVANDSIVKIGARRRDSQPRVRKMKQILMLAHFALRASGVRKELASLWLVCELLALLSSPTRAQSPVRREQIAGERCGDLRRGMSDSAHPSPFGFLCHEAARFTFRLGPPTCFPPGNLPVTEGLSTSRSGDQLSLLARDLLRGAPALTAMGLSPASLIQHDSNCGRICQDAPCRPFYRWRDYRIERRRTVT